VEYGKAQTRLSFDHLRPDVRGHDNDRVAKVHFAPSGVREITLFHDLQQHVKDLGMRLLDLVENDDGIGATTDSLGELARILVAHVARGRSDQPGRRVPLHKFGHVQLQQCVLTAEHELGQRLGQFRLAHPGGAEEYEGTDGPVRIPEPGPGPAHRLGDRRDGLVLADDTPVEIFLHVQQPLRLITVQLGQRDAGPHRDHFCNVIGTDDDSVFEKISLPIGAQGLQPLLQFYLLIPQYGGILVPVFLDGFILGPLHDF
jgi:hypothetical protein